MSFKPSPFYTGTTVFVVPGNGRSKPSFGRRKQFWEGRALPVSRWGPRPELLCSWAHCRSSLVHTLRFFLETAGLGLTDGSSGSVGAGTAAPLGAAESHSCCCSSRSSSLSSLYSRWSAGYSPQMLSLSNKQRKREIMKERGRKTGRQAHISIVVPGWDESYLRSSRSRSGSYRGSKVFEHKWKVEPPCQIAPGNGTDTPLRGGFTGQVYLPGEALATETAIRLSSS